MINKIKISHYVAQYVDRDQRKEKLRTRLFDLPCILRASLFTVAAGLERSHVDRSQISLHESTMLYDIANKTRTRMFVRLSVHLYADVALTWPILIEYPIFIYIFEILRSTRIREIVLIHVMHNFVLTYELRSCLSKYPRLFHNK